MYKDIIFFNYINETVDEYLTIYMYISGRYI